uniref:DEAD-box RNA helicase Q domain-containing protein n=1 Tax=Lactuca sativa TaxID=4236 RepID=A0A9R1XPL1_LACSA|nr:hypothetical protein LSAT_V11C300105380 [Lactuca sativa]
MIIKLIYVSHGFFCLRVIIVAIFVVMATMVHEGSYFDDAQFDSKMNDFFEPIGLKENLSRDIYAYRFEKPSKIQQGGIFPFTKGLDVIHRRPGVEYV